MGLFILLAILVVPVVEIFLFVEVGAQIGAVPAIAATFLTAAAGIALFRHQGLAILADAQQSLARKEMPIAGVFHGIGLLLAGGFLLIPGFLTDAAGLLLFVPPLRLLLVATLARQMLRSGRSTVWVRTGGGPASGLTSGTAGPVIDGEFEDGAEDLAHPHANPRPSLPNTDEKKD